METNAHRYEVLEPATATVLARFVNAPDHSPAITINKFGKGNALYLATESNPSTIGPVLARLLELAGIRPGPSTPEGVYARVSRGPHSVCKHDRRKEDRSPWRAADEAY